MRKTALLFAIFLIFAALIGCSANNEKEFPRKPYTETPIPTEPQFIAANDITRFCYEYESNIYALSVDVIKKMTKAGEMEVGTIFSECRDLITKLRISLCGLTKDNDYKNGGSAISLLGEELKFNCKIEDKYAEGTLVSDILTYTVLYKGEKSISVKLMRNKSGTEADWFCFVNMDGKFYYIEAGKNLKFYADTDVEYQNPKQAIVYDENGVRVTY
ncbi:MAG: hypothetical protein RRY79_06430 [Clostridia bacterium]